MKYWMIRSAVPTVSLLASLLSAGSSLAILPALAQEAPAASETACSGLFCIFGSRPAPTAAQTAAPDPVAQQASELSARGAEVADKARENPKGLENLKGPENPKGLENPEVSEKPDDMPDAKAAFKRRPAKPSITIAAEATAMGRLKSLAAAMPGENVKIVPEGTRGSAGREAVDFTVGPTFGQTGGQTKDSEKARLFTEQMHVVAGPSIATLADLKGKAVSFGPDKGASQAAARKAFAALGIEVKETPLDLDNALDGVGTGDLEAVVIVAPQPLARLKSVRGLHLLSWPDGAALPDGAVATSIDGAAYPGLAKPGETIKTMGVDAVLTLAGKAARKPAAKSFLTDLSRHSGALARHGFDLIKADLETRVVRRVASDERR